MVALQYFLETTIETFDRSVGLWRLRRREPVLDSEGCAQRVELVRAGRGVHEQAEVAIREKCVEAWLAIRFQASKKTTVLALNARMKTHRVV